MVYELLGRKRTKCWRSCVIKDFRAPVHQVTPVKHLSNQMRVMAFERHIPVVDTPKRACDREQVIGRYCGVLVM